MILGNPKRRHASIQRRVADDDFATRRSRMPGSTMHESCYCKDERDD